MPILTNLGPFKAARSKQKTKVIFLVYLFLLAWFKGSVFNMVDAYGVGLSFIFLGIIPILLGLIFWMQKRGETRRKIATLNPVKQLSDNQLFLIKQNAPTSQLELINEVLLISLGLVYELLTSIKCSPGSSATLFDEKFTDVIALFKSLAKRPEFQSSTITSRSRNNAVVCFAFYRILFEGVLDSAIKAGVLQVDIDPWVLLKRIPPKVINYLGSQSWRLFELKTLLFGDLNALEVNDDIKEIMILLCPTTKEIKEKEFKINITKPPREVGELTGNALEISAVEVEESTAQSSSNITALNDPLAKKFDKWLQRQIGRYGINEGGRFFIDEPNYGDKKLFASDLALADFAKKDQLSLKEMKLRLLSLSLADKEEYEYKVSGKQSLTLLLINMEFEVVNSNNPLTGSINRSKK